VAQADRQDRADRVAQDADREDLADPVADRQKDPVADLQKDPVADLQKDPVADLQKDPVAVLQGQDATTCLERMEKAVLTMPRGIAPTMRPASRIAMTWIIF
jgi:hypothetical protein